MRKSLQQIYFKCKRLSLAIKAFKKVYRHGGYTIANIQYKNGGNTLEGKNILVTGGSTGIGFSIALKSIQEGACVVITGRDIKRLKLAKQKINSPNLNILPWDISQVNDITKKISEAEELLNANIDIVINNAGVGNNVEFPNVTTDIWEKIYNTNSKGVFFLTQALCKKWIENPTNKQRKVINISSQGGFVGATYPYRMTKWDIAGLTQGLGEKMAPYGVIVNGIAPGIVATTMQADYTNQKENIFCSQNPLGRFSFPEEIAELAIFLMGDSSNFIVGQTIVCDGGYSIKNK